MIALLHDPNLRGVGLLFKLILQPIKPFKNRSSQHGVDWGF